MCNPLRPKQKRPPLGCGLLLMLAFCGCVSTKSTPPVALAAPMPKSEDQLPASLAEKRAGSQRSSEIPEENPSLPTAGPRSQRAATKAARRDDDKSNENSVPGAEPKLGRHSGGIRLASAAEPIDNVDDGAQESGKRLKERLQIPQALPGADAPSISIPPSDDENPEFRSTAIDALFPPQAKLTSDVQPATLPGGEFLTLEELERQALANNPIVTQAEGDVQAAYGAAIQAGVHPNPTLGYEADTVGSAGTRNYQGVFVVQTIKTAGKLDLARASANVDLMNAQLELRKTKIDLSKRVRNGFYAVLVARENLRISEAVARFTNEVFRVHVDQLKGGQPAAYEPMQLRTLSIAARSAFQQARNRYISAWKQLAATVGTPEMPPTELEGRGDARRPPIDYEAALELMLGQHTDILAARNLEYQGQLNVRRAEVTPIPDINVYTTVQRDFTVPTLGRTTYNMQIGVPLPIFDRNQGNIVRSRGELQRASRQFNRVRLDLTALLADAFERYENNRIQLEYYRNQILPDQARVYRGVYERHQQEPEVLGFTDVVFAQQNLLNAITIYIATMTDRWIAYADIAALLQVDNLNEIPTAPDVDASEQRR